MRWFKHITTSYHDEKIQQMMDEFGLLGYGFYFAIVERIACQLDDKNHTSLRLKNSNWMRYLCISRVKQLKKMLDKCSEIKLFEIEYHDDEITINCPNLLKFRDEWTARKGKSTRELLGSDSVSNPEPLGSKNTEEEVESESDIQTDKEKELKEKESRRKEELERRRKKQVDRFSASFDADFLYLKSLVNGRGINVDWQMTKLLWMNWISDNWRKMESRKEPKNTFTNWLTKRNPFYSQFGYGKNIVCNLCNGTGIYVEGYTETDENGFIKTKSRQVPCSCQEYKLG